MHNKLQNVLLYLPCVYLYLSYDAFKRFIQDKTTINVKSWHQMNTRVTRFVLDTRLVSETRLIFETRLLLEQIASTPGLY